MILRNWLDSILNLFYPRVCAACGESLLKDEETVCLKCRYTLPRTGFELNPDNPLAQAISGRAPIHAITACYFFAKSGKVQHLIHQLKYKGNKEAGVFLGRQLGESIKNAPQFQGIDIIIPVPLHPKRERKRGYNQALIIAQGISEVTGLTVCTKYLLRTVYNETQTHKSAEERYHNVQGIFEVRYADELNGKHVLLVDDVLTTGATLESCAHELEGIPGITISVATAACAGN